MNKHACLAAATGLLLFPASVQAAIFVEDFDSFDIGRSWGVYDTAGQFVTTFGAGIEVQRSGTVTKSHSSGNHLELDSHGRNANSAMAALVDLEVGKVYEVSFAYLPRTGNADDNDISVAIGSLVGRSFTASQQLGKASGTRSTQKEWQTVSFVFTALQADNAVQFAAMGKQNGVGGLLDSIRIQQLGTTNVQATPLPGGAVLFFSALALAFRRLRR